MKQCKDCEILKDKILRLQLELKIIKLRESKMLDTFEKSVNSLSNSMGTI